MTVIPAIDVRGGRAVRLTEGDFNREKVYGDDPLAIARGHAAAGAARLHLVDLDAAVGRAGNRELVAKIVAEAGIEVQVAGGVRDAAAASAWLATGAAAVVMGTVAVREPEVFAAAAAENPGRVIAALDLRGGRPAVTGWTATESVEVGRLLQSWAALPLAGIILTSVDRDGTMTGPDLESLRQVLGWSIHPVTYSGGVRTLDDVRAIATEGAAAVIIGKAIYEGNIDLGEALRTG